MDLQDIANIAREAGRRILAIYEKNDDTHQLKSDASPLTAADLASHDYICTELTRHYPHIPIISEESVAQVDFFERKNWDMCWLIDPLDGTKEFLRRNGEFTVNIALIKQQRPILGVIYAPVLDILYCAAESLGAYRQMPNEALMSLPIYSTDKNKIRVIASKSHRTAEIDHFIQQLEAEGKIVEEINVGSSLKFCRIAEGSADIYPRLGPTMEWDTAAGQIIALESKRTVIDYEYQQVLKYNKEDLHNPWFIVQ